MDFVFSHLATNAALMNLPQQCSDAEAMLADSSMMAAEQ